MRSAADVSRMMRTPFVAVCGFGVYLSPLVPAAAACFNPSGIFQSAEFQYAKKIYLAIHKISCELELGAVQKMLFFNAKQARLKNPD